MSRDFLNFKVEKLNGTLAQSQQQLEKQPDAPVVPDASSTKLGTEPVTIERHTIGPKKAIPRIDFSQIKP